MDQHEKSCQKAKDRIINEIEKNDHYKEFFSQYNTSSVEYFIKRYAHHKANLEVYGDYTKYSQQSLLEGWQRSAWECLEQIQNKKLLDLACKWHAEEVKDLPEIDISIDFSTVQGHILDYSAIPDISEYDVDIYLRFLNSNEHVVDFYSSNIGFSIFQWIKNCYEEHSQTGSQYFDFHNTYTGNNRFLSLPNIRGNKEDEYMELGLAYQQERNIGLMKRSEKPGINTSNKEMMKFARQFNDLKTAYYLEDYEKWVDEKNDFGTRFALNYLNDLYPEVVSVKAHSNWQDSIYDAAITHMQKKVCEILPSVYQEYLMKKNAGITITPENSKEKDDSINEWYKELIFTGREMKGEPRDFNF